MILEDDFIDYDLTLIEYINEIVRSFKEISNKEFITNYHKYENPIKINDLLENHLKYTLFRKLAKTLPAFFLVVLLLP